MSDEEIAIFQALLLGWYDKNKRSFPWRYTFDPYKVFVSEILLQQTNVEKVINPYIKIVNEYKNIHQLSEADNVILREIFKSIGLFYRADRMINISKEIVSKHNGNIPDTWDYLIKIKGIGRYICSAILCFGYNKPYAILDTNVIRVFDRVLGIMTTQSRAREDVRLWSIAQMILPENDYIDFNYAILDFASSVCTAKSPKCRECPFKFMCFFEDKISIDT